jgi:hypothetical protein
MGTMDADGFEVDSGGFAERNCCEIMSGETERGQFKSS